jgi:hypothetical protein
MTGERSENRQTALRRLAWLVLSAVLLGSILWRLACVRMGPDPDTDAYGHYIIARLMADTPLNLNIHWVWLPFYHALLALPVRLGATLDHVRSANAVLAALPPLLANWALTGERSQRASPPYPQALATLLPFGVALLVALDPLMMQLGTTGQMEIVFCSLLLLATGLLARRQHAWAAGVLGLLVLTRYEGWAVAASVGAVLAYRRVFAGEPLGRGGLACLFVPALCVLGWAALRRAGGGSWFGFLLDNQAFAERVLESNPPALGALGALGRYTVSVPYRVFGVAALFAPFGIRRTWQRHGVWLVAPGLSLIAFLTLSSLSRSQLGLDRHFLSVVPFATTWIAQGIVRCAEAVGTALGRRHTDTPGRLTHVLLAVVAGAVLTGSTLRLGSSSRAWQDATRNALPEPRALARFLRSTPASSLLVCAEASIEVLSELDRQRFLRFRLDAHTAPRLAELARARDVIVVDRAWRLQALLRAGHLSHGAVDGPPDAFVAVFLPAGSAAVMTGIAALP